MEKTTYKAVFSDIDGTVLNNQHQMSEKTLQAIERISQKGIPFVLVSARPPLAITPYTERLNVGQPIISYGGALILDQDLKPLYSVTIAEQDLEVVERILADFQHLSINHYVGVNWFCNDTSSPWIVQEQAITGQKAVKKIQNLANVHKILVMGDTQEILRLEAILKQVLPDLSIYRSKDEYLEIMNKQATKSNAIRFMQKMLDLRTEQVVAFGDNFNDLDMLQYAGLGVAMGNAPEEVKAGADYVTVSNEQDGVAKVLNEIF